ncbi:phosphotransferase [Curvibacter sp. APW13]|uniref:aminoglycoside phosphotransferase family protein n=1 Tax=Curvibacter sp. APW13 TaxID=3077236 RepID=UPI0028DF7986|nr:phosphotransferase [Curvibacter sp. APW13]MDT8990500.1 phosphotransferase [Curvibacter sp. APW13]
MSATPPSPTSSSPLAEAPVVWNDPVRQALFLQWLWAIAPQHGLRTDTVRLASADASFRRYLRVDSDQGSRIIMDAPPDKENCLPFVQIDRLMQAAGLRVPEILAWDEAHGFMLLSDLGSQTLMQTIDPEAPPPLAAYLEAVDVLVQWQKASQPGVLPPYDEALLRRELELFPDWYIAQHRGVSLDEAQRKTLDEAFTRIVRANLASPSVYVHRDFMPRNLMVGVDVAPTLGAGASSLPPEGAIAARGGPAPLTHKLGVLDFQDAVYGPITYDIASLMRDAFLSWDEEFCLDVTIRYWDKARKAGLPVGDDFGDFYRAVEWMGLQRHLKVAGIFARLTLRDGKPKYLADTPRFIHYIRATCSRYIELKPLLRLVESIEGIEAPSAYAFGRV